MNELERALIATVRYFDLFDIPVTAVQLWRGLVQPAPRTSLHDVEETLRTSPALQEKLGQRYGYYYLAGKEELVTLYLHRFCIAQDKWRIAERAGRWLMLAPFVRAIAVSGSLAMNNTRLTSDIDIFVIAQRGRIWTARLLLLLIAQLLGRRRKYWDQQAPDKICLNHYVTDRTLAIAPDIRHLYNAMTYRWLVLLGGDKKIWQQFRAENQAWLNTFVKSPRDTSSLASVHEVALGTFARWLKKQLELFLREAPGQWLEQSAARMQRRISLKHTEPGRPGRVVLSHGELAFHPDTKASAILDRFQKAGVG